MGDCQSYIWGVFDTPPTPVIKTWHLLPNNGSFHHGLVGDGPSHCEWGLSLGLLGIIDVFSKVMHPIIQTPVDVVWEVGIPERRQDVLRTACGPHRGRSLQDVALGLRGTSRGAAQMQFLTRLGSWVVARGRPGSWCSGQGGPPSAVLLLASSWARLCCRVSRLDFRISRARP